MKSGAGAVLVVDDDADIRSLLGLWLREAGFEVLSAASGAEALGCLALTRPRLVVTDLRMEGMDGLALAAHIEREHPQLPIIMLSGEAGVPEAVRAMRLGIVAFLTKPPSRETLLAELERALRLSPEGAASGFGGELIHRSVRMSELLEQAELVAASDLSVFIHGETGTGKDVLARAIHAASPRREQAFIGVNCGAIPEHLLESELFGHEKGAFTGALQRHEGLFQAAHGGTLFLDEVGDMPLGLQVKLLRVLQDLEVRPVGATRSQPVDVRVLSATHGDLEAAVREGRFRADLYYRLNVVPLAIPPLRDRAEDIPLLVEHFLGRIARRRGGARKRFAPEALEHLLGAAWPGNVRQLLNAVELCAALTRGDSIPLAMAQRALREQPGRLQTLQEARDACDRGYLTSVLRITEGHVANAARIAGRNRTEFYKLLNEHGLDPAQFRIARGAAGKQLERQRA